jgi:hypothetical protein
MSLPFTIDEFLGVFADYNRAFVWVVATLWLTTIGVLVFARRRPGGGSRVLTLFLAGLWLWNAVAYHALFFTRINPAAWVFATMFLIQALAFLWAATRGRIEYFSSAGWIRGAGLGLVWYALAYPFLTAALGHRYPAMPTFGVPCPTAILTLGLLLTARGRMPLLLAAIPVLWGFIGGSAATILAVPTDYVLLAAAIFVTVVLIGQRVRPSSVSL